MSSAFIPGDEGTAATVATSSAAVPSTEAAIPWEAAGISSPEEFPSTGDELPVSIRLLDEGALVRWERADGESSRCAVRWYEGDALLSAIHTHHDYYLGEIIGTESWCFG